MFLFGFTPLASLVISGAGAFFFAPIVAGVVAVFSSILHVLFDVPLTVFWLCGLAASTVVTFAVRSLRERSLKSLSLAWTSVIDRIGLAIAAVATLASLASTPPPLGWDARSMWFAIPSWLNGPAEQYLTAQAGGAQTGWAEYPLFGPGSFATVWQLSGVLEDLWQASRLAGVMAVMAAALAAYLLLQEFGRDKNIWLAGTTFAGYVLAAFFLADGTINNGYMDALQGLLVAATLAAALSFDKSKAVSGLAVISIISVAAAATKQEGFWFTLGVILLGVFFHGFQKAFVFFAATVPILMYQVVWGLFGNATGMSESASTAGIGDKAPELLSPGSTAMVVISKIFMDWFSPQYLLPIIIFVFAAITFGFSSQSKLSARLGSIMLAAGSVLGVTVVIFITYALGGSRDSIDWWLGTSYTRIMSTPMALGWLVIVSAVLVNLNSTSSRVMRLSKPAKKAKR